MRGHTALAVLIATLSGCGYTTGLSLPLERRTIGIELFANDSPERDLERELHTRLLRKTRELVDARVVAPERAEVVMRLGEWESRRGHCYAGKPPTAGRSGVLPPGHRVCRFRGGEVQTSWRSGLAAPPRLPPFRVRSVSSSGVPLLVVRPGPAVLLAILQWLGAPSECPRRRSTLPADAAWATASRPSPAVVSGASAKESDASRLPQAGELCDGYFMPARAAAFRVTRGAGVPEEPGSRLRGLWPPLRGDHPHRLSAPAAPAARLEGARG